jgi:hypothetical protein
MPPLKVAQSFGVFPFEQTTEELTFKNTDAKVKS